jgi:hypothetical protein
MLVTTDLFASLERRLEEIGDRGPFCPGLHQDLQQTARPHVHTSRWTRRGLARAGGHGEAEHEQVGTERLSTSTRHGNGFLAEITTIYDLDKGLVKKCPRLSHLGLMPTHRLCGELDTDERESDCVCGLFGLFHEVAVKLDQVVCLPFEVHLSLQQLVELLPGERPATSVKKVATCQFASRA